MKNGKKPHENPPLSGEVLPPVKNDGRFKPGHRPKWTGRPPSAKESLTQLFLRNLKASWVIHGEAALTAAAWSDPLGYVRVVASLVPKEIDVTVTPRAADRLDDARLAVTAVAGSEDFAEEAKGPEILQ